MDLLQERFSYADTETESVLSVANFNLATIERPWIAANDPGGKPFQSCIPDGVYSLEPWIRANERKDEVYILVNEELGVYRLEEDMPNGVGRYLILWHIANFVTDVVGCAGPGMRRALMKNKKTGQIERSVSSSGEAMRIITTQLGRVETHRLTIRAKCGTGEAA